MTDSSMLIARPPAFLYRKTNANKTLQLHCEQASLAEVAARFGTPAYIYSAGTIELRFKTLDRAFRKDPHTICYSVKANSNLSLLRLLHKMGSGFDVVSGGELERVLRVSKRAAQNTVFSGVGKTAEEMDAALRAGILMFNLESESEMRLLAERAGKFAGKIAGKIKTRASVAFRVNPDVVAQTHPYISTGLRKHKFGVPIADAERLYAAAAEQRWLEVRGISAHIGSQITSVQPFAAALGRVAELARELLSAGHKIRYIDAGGGLGIPYNHGQEDFSATASAYAQALLRSLHQLKIHLLLEPGRSILGPAGVLLTRVLYLKQNGEKRFAVVDAAMNDLLRPSLYDAYHEIVPVDRREDSGRVKLDIVGPICETGDFFAHDREMPVLQEGDLLAILDAGAYGMSLASNYNSRPRPIELLVDGKKVKVIRKRETVKDLMELER